MVTGSHDCWARPRDLRMVGASLWRCQTFGQRNPGRGAWLPATRKHPPCQRFRYGAPRPDALRPWHDDFDRWVRRTAPAAARYSACGGPATGPGWCTSRSTALHVCGPSDALIAKPLQSTNCCGRCLDRLPGWRVGARSSWSWRRALDLAREGKWGAWDQRRCEGAYPGTEGLGQRGGSSPAASCRSAMFAATDVLLVAIPRLWAA